MCVFCLSHTHILSFDCEITLLCWCRESDAHYHKKIFLLQGFCKKSKDIGRQYESDRRCVPECLLGGAPTVESFLYGKGQGIIMGLYHSAVALTVMIEVGQWYCLGYRISNITIKIRVLVRLIHLRFVFLLFMMSIFCSSRGQQLMYSYWWLICLWAVKS